MKRWIFSLIVMLASGLVCSCVPERPYQLSCPYNGDVSHQCAGATDTVKGLAIIIHGGGWQDDGTLPNDNLTLATEKRWNERGWAALRFSYKPSKEGPMSETLRNLMMFFEPSKTPPEPVSGSALDSIRYVEWVYDHRTDSDFLGATLGGKPTCVVGFSAGGHLALKLAADRPEVACVIADAGPTNLIAAPLEPTDPDPEDPNSGDTYRYIAGAFAQFSFGAPGESNASGLRSPDLSPAYLAGQNKYSLNTRILIGVTSNDGFVGTRHGIDFTVNRGCMKPYRCKNTRMVKLDPATDSNDPNAVWFVHSYVTRAALEAYRQQEGYFADCTIDSASPSCQLITE